MADWNLHDKITVDPKDTDMMLIEQEDESVKNTTILRFRNWLMSTALFNTLTTTSKTILGAIEEIKGKVEDNTTQLNESMQMIFLTRDLTLDGVQSYTGLTRKPRGCIINAAVYNEPNKSSQGFANGESNTCLVNTGNTTTNSSTVSSDRSISIQEDGGNRTEATVTFTDNGFNINWSKVGTGATGTLRISVLVL